MSGKIDYRTRDTAFDWLLGAWAFITIFLLVVSLSILTIVFLIINLVSTWIIAQRCRILFQRRASMGKSRRCMPLLRLDRFIVMSLKIL